MYRNDPRLNLANSPTFLIHIENCRVNLLLHPLSISRPKSGGPWPFIPPDLLNLSGSTFPHFLLRGQTQPVYPGFALVGRFGFRHKSSCGRHHYPAGTPQNERGRAVPFGWLAFRRGILQKKYSSIFLLFKELSPCPLLVNLILAILTSYFWIINFIFPKI